MGSIMVFIVSIRMLINLKSNALLTFKAKYC